MRSIRLGSFSVSPWSFHLSVTTTIPRRAPIALVWVPRCLSHLKKPQTSRKSSSGSWLPFRATSTLSNASFLPVNPDECSAFVWVLFLLISVLPPLSYRNHPQTSADRARLGSFAVSHTSSNPRRAARARLGPSSLSAPPRHF